MPGDTTTDQQDLVKLRSCDSSLAHANIVCNVLIPDRAQHSPGRRLKRSRALLRPLIRLDQHPANRRVVLDRDGTSFDSHRAPARIRRSVATEAVVASRAVHQHHARLIAFVLHAEIECRHRERTARRVARSVGCGAGNGRSSKRETTA